MSTVTTDLNRLLDIASRYTGAPDVTGNPLLDFLSLIHI